MDLDEVVREVVERDGRAMVPAVSGANPLDDGLFGIQGTFKGFEPRVIPLDGSLRTLQVPSLGDKLMCVQVSLLLRRQRI